MKLQDLKFIKEIQSLGGNIYSVGGSVRDEILGLESKDLDVLVTGIPMDELELIVSKYGRVDAVGKSFGVLKFMQTGSDMDVDIAIPRTEKPTGEGGHKGFEVVSDHNLSIEEDLFRRDFTINSIAKGLDGDLIDPFFGVDDLKNKIIRVVNSDAFADDPLRMVRAVQFAARFDGFMIEEKTLKLIKENAHRIKEIAGERIIEEFKKIITKKGDVLYAADILRETGLYKEIFGEEPSKEFVDWWDCDEWEDVMTLGEFLFMLTKPISSVVFNNELSEKLKLDNKTFNELRALSYADALRDYGGVAAKRYHLSKVNQICPKVLDSKILPEEFKFAVHEFKDGLYPKNISELLINGNDLIDMGFKGKLIRDTLEGMLVHIYQDKISNNKKDLLNFAKSF